MNSSSPFKDNVLKGKVALITGGGSGIGLEITRQLGLHGASVFILGRRSNVLQESCTTLQQQGITAAYKQADVRKPEDCEAGVRGCVERYGRLDVLVNCAAGNFLAVAEELTPNGFKTVMDIDAVGTFVTSRAAYAELRKTRGCVVNISATLHYGATWWQAHASAAKAAVDSLTRSLALEWGEFGVRVNGVAPGPIQDTAGVAKLLPADDEAAKDAAARAMIPLARWGTKWDIAMAVVFLASPAAAFVTGETMVVDGAAWMHRTPLVPRSVVSKLSRGVEGQSRGVGLAKSKL